MRVRASTGARRVRYVSIYPTTIVQDELTAGRRNLVAAGTKAGIAGKSCCGSSRLKIVLHLGHTGAASHDATPMLQLACLATTLVRPPRSLTPKPDFNFNQAGSRDQLASHQGAVVRVTVG